VEDKDFKQAVKDTKKAMQMARSWKRQGRSAYSFERLINHVWPTGVKRLGSKLYHIVAYTWELKQ